MSRYKFFSSKFALELRFDSLMDIYEFPELTVMKRHKHDQKKILNKIHFLKILNKLS